jgi:lipoate-protein ligase A
MTHEFPAYDADEGLLEALRGTGRAQLVVRRVPQVMVVLGRSSKVDRELHLQRCHGDGVPILRRRGGGCAVVLDPGNLVISLAMPVPGFGHVDRLWHGLTAWLLGGLEDAGVHGLYRDGICDLVLEDRKVGGAAMYRARDLVYYSTTLLLAPRTDLMARYLPHPPREPAYRRGRDHADFVGAIGEVQDLAQRLPLLLKPPRAASLLGQQEL